jgi:small subunit ribosomal protein S4
MKIGPKYKIARRLRAPIFEKTQSQKYSLREAKKLKNKPMRPKTAFGLQLTEKQKARMFYGVTEKQFAKYVKLSLSKKGESPVQNLLSMLERRLDNVVWRAGFLPTHLAARQAVAHGHFKVNGRRVYVPSYEVRPGDMISVREGSDKSKLFSDDETRAESRTLPDWLSLKGKREIEVKKTKVAASELLFDLGQVIEYYQR